MGEFSIWHWLVVVAVVLLIFGTGRVSSLMGEFGKGIRAFRQSVADDEATKAKGLSTTALIEASPFPTARVDQQSRVDES